MTAFDSLPKDLPLLKNIEEFAKAFGIEPKVFTNIFGILIGAQTVTSFFSGNFKTAIMGAFTLYLDFINLFLYMLRFFGDRK